MLSEFEQMPLIAEPAVGVMNEALGYYDDNQSAEWGSVVQDV
jgi:hypothetical protein